VATHYVRSSRLPSLEAELAALEEPTVRDVAALIDTYAADDVVTGMCA
jgi:hypothetical protein